ncbi:MAG: phosphoglycerate mutase family protein [bacterium]|nr:phosphoglycerate mutase family protein [bacterium]
MSEKFKEIIEKKESVPFEADMRVDFFRHGKVNYTAEELASAKYEGQLGDVGRKQVEAGAQKLAQSIDRERELVVLWASPRQRAQESAEIIAEILKAENIGVIQKLGKKDIRKIGALRDVGLSPEFMKAKGPDRDWMEFWDKADNLPESTEAPESLKERSLRILAYLEKISRLISPPADKKLHFICVGHEESFKELLSEGFGQGVEKESRPANAETMRLDIFHSGAKPEFRLKYRDEEADLKFDSAERKIYK